MLLLAAALLALVVQQDAGGCTAAADAQADLPSAPGVHLPVDFSIPGDKLDEAALPVDANQAHIFFHARQLQDATPSTCAPLSTLCQLKQHLYMLCHADQYSQNVLVNDWSLVRALWWLLVLSVTMHQKCPALSQQRAA